MTPRGTFIINGAERVVVSQLHRSPGVSFDKEVNLQIGKDLFVGKIIPYKGTWLEFETDKNDFLNVKIDRKKKVLATVFLKAIDFFDTNEDIMNEFLEIKELDLSTFYEKYANKQDLLDELKVKMEGSFLKEDIIDEENGEFIGEASTVISEELLSKIIDKRIMSITYWEVKPEEKILANTILNDSTETKEEAVTEVFKKLRPGDLVTVDSAKSLIKQMFFNPQRYDLEPVGRYKLNKRLGLDIPETQILLTKEDIVRTMEIIMDLYNGEGHTDDIDNLCNRRIRGVGELLLMQIRTGLAKMGKMVKEKMTIQRF